MVMLKLSDRTINIIIMQKVKMLEDLSGQKRSDEKNIVVIHDSQAMHMYIMAKNFQDNVKKSPIFHRGFL